MLEVGIGVFFSVWMITTYLIFNKLSRPDTRGRTRLRTLITPTPLDALTAPRTSMTKSFLTTTELSEHHAPSMNPSIDGKDRQPIQRFQLYPTAENRKGLFEDCR